MPELPEVETVRRGLLPKVKNKIIRGVTINYEKIIKNVSPEDFVATLVGNEIVDIDRRGKHLIIKLKGISWIIHLRMEGKLFYYDQNYTSKKHDHLVFQFTDGSYLVYNDTRKFGTMDIVQESDLGNFEPLAKLGIEANSSELSVEYLQGKFKNSNRAIKQSLLDQTVINGLGNIYVDEVLYASKINPLKPTKELKEDEIEKIIVNSREILNRAIEKKGTTVKSFEISEGESGNFQFSLEVYGRANEQCNICGTPIEKIKVCGRGTSFCPVCQK